jgi:hypothetical protein
LAILAAAPEVGLTYQNLRHIGDRPGEWDVVGSPICSNAATRIWTSSGPNTPEWSLRNPRISPLGPSGSDFSTNDAESVRLIQRRADRKAYQRKLRIAGISCSCCTSRQSYLRAKRRMISRNIGSLTFSAACEAATFSVENDPGRAENIWWGRSSPSRTGPPKARTYVSRPSCDGSLAIYDAMPPE